MTISSKSSSEVTAHLAFDLGAGSGRAILGFLQDHELEIVEAHRFEHAPVEHQTGLLWDIAHIWNNIQTGLTLATELCHVRGIKLHSVGVDSWGVDWCVVDTQGNLLGGPFCYRDPIYNSYADGVDERIGGFAQLYRRTGIQRLPFNTIYQVYGRLRENSAAFADASRLLFLPDLLHYWLSGVMATERTIASTSGLLHLDTHDWDHELMRELELPTAWFGAIHAPGTVLGNLRADLAVSALAGPNVQVVMPAAHDTASAVVAAPAQNDGSAWAFLSSGTWSLLGTERDMPCNDDAAEDVPFTNELGVDGTIRFLRNISGLWLVQELRRELREAGHDVGYAELVAAAEEHLESVPTFNPNAPALGEPGPMSEKIQATIAAGGNDVPESTAALVRSCLESLAVDYRATMDLLESVTGQNIDIVHVLGGGCQNELLKKLTSKALGRTTTFGPIEASGIGNMLVQAQALGRVTSLEHAREIVRRSCAIEVHDPTIPDRSDASAFSTPTLRGETP